MPGYMTIGTNFRVEYKNKVQDFLGPVVASKDAYYLVVEMNHGKAALASALGGALGLFVMNLLESDKPHEPRLLETDLSQLPAKITKHPDWPVKYSKKGRVFVIPRNAIERIDYSFWDTYDIQTAEHIFSIGLKLFTRWTVTKYLRTQGWEF
jgi:hypothetical protein